MANTTSTSTTNLANNTITFTIVDTSSPTTITTTTATTIAAAEESSTVASQAAGSSDTNNPTRVPRGVPELPIWCIGKNNGGVTWGSVKEKGRRTYMEDNVATVGAFMNLTCTQFGGCTAPDCEFARQVSPVHFFGVYDGHGGSEVSVHCAEVLHWLVVEEWQREDRSNAWSTSWEAALRSAFQREDDAFSDGTLAPHSVGSTAVVVILSACQIITANCGDSRAVLCRGKQAFPLTVDQKPERPDEFARVTSGGARILNWGCLRVEGILSMTRAIGDHDLKPWVISVPEVTFTTRSEEDEFLILASDGLWEVMSTEDVIKLARLELRRQRRVSMRENRPMPPAWYVSQHLLLEALDSGSSDNISVIVVDLKSPRRRHREQL